MSTRLRDVLMARARRTAPRADRQAHPRALGDTTVVDSTRALLVWEPRRIVPTYAVPVEDVAGELRPAPATAAGHVEGVSLGARKVLDPSIPFTVHTADGEPAVLRAAGREVAGFRPADEALAGHVVLDFAGFDAWYEEDERNVSHPRDPFHRIDIVHSSRHVRVEHDGGCSRSPRARTCCSSRRCPCASTCRPRTSARTCCGQATSTPLRVQGPASYWSLPDLPDVAWSYPQPLREAAEVTDRFAFFNEFVDLIVDGERLERPLTPWSRR